MMRQKIIRSAFFLSIFFSINPLNAAACTPCISTPGENAWILADSILATMCSGVNFISQADIPITITASGLYCLSEDITSAANATTPITVSGNDIVINLNGFSITKPSSTDGVERYIVSFSGASNVGLINGHLIGTDPGTPSGNFDLVKISNTNNFFGYRVSAFTEVGTSARTIFRIDTGSSGGIIYQCTCFNPGTANSVFMTNSSDYLFREFDAINSLVCIWIEISDNVQCIDCTAQSDDNGTLSFGFVFRNLVDNFVCKDCCNMNNNSGFTSLVSAGNVSTNYLVDSCLSQFCAAAQFSLNRTFNQAVYTNCIANAGELHGFSISTTPLVSNVSIISCKATNHNQRGFNNEANSSYRVYNGFAANNPVGNYVGPFITPIVTLDNINDGVTSFWSNFSA